MPLQLRGAGRVRRALRWLRQLRAGVMTTGLFPEPDRLPEAPDPLEGLGADARRTVKQRMAIERGFHPLTGRPLLARDFSGEVPPTCGDCRKRFVIRHHNRSYGKCEERGDTSCAASDCRKWWPACDLFEAS